MARLTEEMVIARSKQSDLNSIRKLNCWGAELADVSILRRMPNVEVLAFSINKLRTLSSFASCVMLRELYLRKNEIQDLRDIRYLRRLPRLTSLWLEENPCAEHPNYRQTVLRNLPNLEKLDNVVVHPDEVESASQRGAYIPDSDEEEELLQRQQQQQQQEVQYCRRSSVASSPEPDSPRTQEQPTDPAAEPPAETKTESQPVEEYSYGNSESPRRTPPPAMTRSYHPERCPAETSPGVRHSQSALNVKEYAYTGNGSGENYYERCDRNDSVRGEVSSSREYPSAVMGNLRGFTRRPVTRNSNLLSAVLCLVKELDYPSLEVAEMAVRCRMDELANSQ